jgi:transcription initiation factor IIF auxiliary subunit
MKPRALQVALRDSVHRPNAPRGAIVYDEALPERPRYRVWIYLEGPDLPYVRSATYTLHPTFADPVRTVERTSSNPNCALDIWTWGLFEVVAEIADKSGGRHLLRHRLRYDEDLSRDARYERVKLAQ